MGRRQVVGRWVLSGWWWVADDGAGDRNSRGERCYDMVDSSGERCLSWMVLHVVSGRWEVVW